MNRRTMRRKQFLAILWCFVSCLVVSTGCSRNWLAQTEPMRPSRYRPTPLESEPESQPEPEPKQEPDASAGDAARQPVRRRVGDEPPQVSQAVDQRHREDLQKFFAAHPEAIAVTPREILERAGIGQASYQSALQEDKPPAGSDQAEPPRVATDPPLEIQRPVNPQAQQLLSNPNPQAGGPERLPSPQDASVVQAATSSETSPAQGGQPHLAGAATGSPNPHPAQASSQAATAKTTTLDPAQPPNPNHAASSNSPSPAAPAHSHASSPAAALSGGEPNQLAADARVATPLLPADATPVPPVNSAVGSADTVATAVTPPAESGSDETESPPVADWTQLLADATAALHNTLNQPLGPDKRDSLEPAERARLEAKLRLLQMLANRPDEAMRPIESLDPDQQRFWTEQVFGLHKLLETQGPPVDSQRATLALNHLRAGAAHLSVFSKLDLNNIAFCRKVDYYGGYTTFDSAVFKAGQEVLLYVEVDNFAAEEQSRGDVVTSSRPRVVASRPLKTPDTTMYETELRGSYQVLDAGGRQMVDQALPVDKQVCRNRRRDYFIAYRIYLPKDLQDGRYTLQLTMEDAKAKKFGQAWIDFEIEK